MKKPAGSVAAPSRPAQVREETSPLYLGNTLLPHVLDGAAVGSRLGQQHSAYKPGTKPASSTAEPVVRHGGYRSDRTEPAMELR